MNNFLTVNDNQFGSLLFSNKTDDYYYNLLDSSSTSSSLSSHSSFSSNTTKKREVHESIKSTKKTCANEKSLYKTELCKNWEETNQCRYGSKCQYAHGLSELREIERHPKYKTQLCRTFDKTGSCPYGSRCTFRHFNLPEDDVNMASLKSKLMHIEEDDFTLPSNAESFLPHQLLSDLDDDKSARRCPLRNYVSLPNFNPHHLPQQQDKSFFHPWLF